MEGNLKEGERVEGGGEGKERKGRREEGMEWRGNRERREREERREEYYFPPFSIFSCFNFLL